MLVGGNHSESQHRNQGALKRFFQVVVLTSLIVTGGLALCRFLGFFERLEIAAYDSFIGLKPSDPPDDRLLIVGIGENDIQSRQEYPIKEGTVVELIEALERYEPRAIALDFALDFPQGTPAEREELINLLASSDRIISSCVMSTEQFPGVPPAPGSSVESVGIADLPEDKDGITRRGLIVSTPTELPTEELVRPHLCNQSDAELLSLSFLLALIYLEDEEIFADQNDVGHVMWDTTVVHGLFERSGGYASTGAVDYQVMLNYRAPSEAIQHVSLTDMLQDQVDPELIRDRIILVGYTSPVVGDILTTPYTETAVGLRGMFGVEVHAQATSQLISAVLDGRPLIWSFPEIGEIVLVGLWSLTGGLIAFYARRPFIFLLSIISIFLGLWGFAYYLFIQGLWLPVMSMTVAAVLTAVVVNVINQARQSVYAQAIFEQIKAQITGEMVDKSGAERDRLGDLVQRAQSLRQRQAFGGVLERGEIDRADTDPLQMEFDSPEVQTFYERIKTQLQQKFDEEKITLETRVNQKETSSQSTKLKALLKKSQTARGVHSPPP